MKQGLEYHDCHKDDREAQYDGYGIFLCYTCPTCYDVKMSRYRPDIFDHYEADESIEDPDVESRRRGLTSLD